MFSIIVFCVHVRVCVYVSDRFALVYVEYGICMYGIIPYYNIIYRFICAKLCC